MGDTGVFPRIVGHIGNANGPSTITRAVPHLMEKRVELSGLRAKAARAA